MFDNIGKKIQIVAKVTMFVDAGLSILGGIVMFFSAFVDIEMWPLIFLAPIVTVIGCLMAWVSVLTLYGFGKLIEDVEVIRNNTTSNTNNANESFSEKIIKRKVTVQAEGKRDSSSTVHKWRCENCGSMCTQTPCEYCGEE